MERLVAADGQVAWAAPQDFTIAVAEQCRQACLERLAALVQDEAFGAIDLSRVERVDTAALQLLLSLRLSLGRREQALVISACSDAVREALALYGLNELAHPEAA